jgi:hypothetical protein
MEFYTWEPAVNTTNSLLVDCSYEFGNGVLLAINVTLCLFILSHMFDWCRDPVHQRLREKITQLEDENTQLLVQIEDMNDEIEEKQNTLDNLRDVLLIKRDLNPESDGESLAKRRRVA